MNILVNQNAFKTSLRQSRISKNFPGGETPGTPLKAAVSNASKGHCQESRKGRRGKGRMEGGDRVGGNLAPWPLGG